MIHIINRILPVTCNNNEYNHDTKKKISITSGPDISNELDRTYTTDVKPSDGTLLTTLDGNRRLLDGKPEKGSWLLFSGLFENKNNLIETLTIKHSKRIEKSFFH